MTIQSFPPTQIPEIKDDYGFFQNSVVVLGKLKNGEVFTVFAHVYLNDDLTVEDFHWCYTGPDSYTVGENNLVSWAHIPEF
jgi:hypothetical protein